MKRNSKRRPLCWLAFPVVMLAVLSCEVLDDDIEKHVSPQDSTDLIGLDEVAEVFSTLPITLTHLNEVHDAVTSSSGNGYDEEYTMKNLFEAPGAGVGEQETKSGAVYDNPLRELLEEGIRARLATKASGEGSGRNTMNADEYLAALMASDVQVYWPFSDEWDGKSMPVVTYDPEDGSEVNTGYELIVDDEGFRHVQEVIVDEKMAKERPVWVINRNSDAGYTTLELLRREDPDWGEGGGDIVVSIDPERKLTKAQSEGGFVKTLILKEFTMKRNFDPWFAGASEFFVKIGYLHDFTASTEAELKLYNPMVTDFMVVVKRSQVGIPQNVNVIMMSEWREEDNDNECAFMITEDDGGTQDDFSFKAKVYVAGKSYGVEMTLPFRTRDDIVWRGKIPYSMFEKYQQTPSPFGDVELTFDVQEY